MEELQGCWYEAIRADSVATELLRIRSIFDPSSSLLSLPTSDYEIITTVLRHVEEISRLLRDLHDLFLIYQVRVPFLIYYLALLLPCLQKTLRDMLEYLKCDDFSATVKWSLMHERLNEQGGLSLECRFVMYVEFLVQLVRFLKRAFDKNRLSITLYLDEMVLFHCSFVALKAHSQLTNLIPRDDYIIEGEERLFQGQIVDDQFHHSLYIYRDRHSHTLRLHAAVAEGELKRCPVWTAFVTDLQITSETWLVRHTRHRVWVQDLHLNIFCDQYHRRAQVQKHGEFELHFVRAAAADAFIEVFYPMDYSSDSERAIEDVPRAGTLGY
ncbi:hypothetical protein NHQ30_006954 [Ciborinia camelliae]|nr:hypothetical protein NHQ30_006954 [Ciborinia camelliae]